MMYILQIIQSFNVCRSTPNLTWAAPGFRHAVIVMLGGVTCSASFVTSSKPIRLEPVIKTEFIIERNEYKKGLIWRAECTIIILF